MLQENKDVVQAFFKAVGRGDAEAASDLLSLDVVVVSAVEGTSLTAGTRNYRQALEAIEVLSRVVMDGIDFEIVALTAEDDRVSIWLNGRSILVNGTEYNNQYHNLLTVREGKIVHMREMYCTKLVDSVIVPLMQSADG